nr:MAG TPA: homing endonuclease [Caudoviricetes sp.]
MQTIANGQSAGKQVVFKELPVNLNGFEKKYKITNDGRIYSECLGDFIKPFYSKGGYVRVKLNYGDRSKKFMMHRLVAMAFIPNPDNKPVVDHINRNRADNRVENLQWVTTKENCELAVERGSKDSMLYRFINTKTGEILEFSNRHKMLKHFGKFCLRYLRQIASGVRTSMSGMFADYVVERIPLKPQRLSPSGEYTQVGGSGENLTATKVVEGCDIV